MDLSKDKAGNSLVNDVTVEAFCFDVFFNSFFSIRPNSMDAIVLKNNMYLIEFKRVVSSYNNSKQQIIIKQNLQLKLISSLYVIKEIIFKSLGLPGSSFSKVAVIVIDHLQSPTTAVAVALSNLSKRPLTKNSFVSFFSKDRNGQYCFYDSLEIWNDLNFSSKIKQIV